MKGINKNMKKLILLILCISVMAAFAGCTDKDKKSSSKSEDASQQTVSQQKDDIVNDENGTFGGDPNVSNPLMR